MKLRIVFFIVICIICVFIIEENSEQGREIRDVPNSKTFLRMASRVAGEIEITSNNVNKPKHSR